MVENQVLVRLAEPARAAILRSAVRERLRPWQVLRGEGEPIVRVYFPLDAIISIVTLMEDGRTAESYTAGSDGMAGSEAFWGRDRSIFRTMCQVPGLCYSIDLNELRGIAKHDPSFLDTVHAYAHCALALAGRSGACNMVHNVVERCARWLLLTHDRVRTGTFELTQDILSTMLGVHRPAVSVAAGTLQKAGLIRYARGRITIVDRSGLEEASCECYRVIADEFVRVMGGPVPLSDAPSP